MTPQELKRRLDYVGGSDANIIASGDAEKIHKLWLVKTRQDEGENLDDVLAVQVGVWTEEFNARWYTKQTGDAVTSRGQWLTHENGWQSCTLDGLCQGGSAVWEAKHVGGFEPVDTVLARYMPQLQHNMFIADKRTAVLSLFIGSGKWEAREVARDDFYIADLMDKERQFWKHVKDKTPPNDFGALESIQVSEFRTVDMTGNNAWAGSAAEFLENVDAAKRLGKAKKEIKDLLERDVGEAFGHGIVAKRAKNGAVTITKEK